MEDNFQANQLCSVADVGNVEWAEVGTTYQYSEEHAPRFLSQLAGLSFLDGVPTYYCICDKKY